MAGTPSLDDEIAEAERLAQSLVALAGRERDAYHASRSGDPDAARAHRRVKADWNELFDAFAETCLRLTRLGLSQHARFLIQSTVARCADVYDRAARDWLTTPENGVSTDGPPQTTPAHTGGDQACETLRDTTLPGVRDGDPARPPGRARGLFRPGTPTAQGEGEA